MVLTLVTILGSIIYVVEGESSGFDNIPVSIYWAIVTLTTVGYGDMSPQTPFGQLIASIVMILGYCIIAVPTGLVSVDIANSLKKDSNSWAKLYKNYIISPQTYYKIKGTNVKPFK